jgi:glycerol-3-phosphate acyltransferase PlsY
VIAAVLALLASYLLGAVPTSHLVSRTFARIDLREHGSGNLGATNLYRVLGWRYAVPVGLFDIAKGVIPVLVFAPLVWSSELFQLACGIAAIIGHVFSIFVNFKGGKGVATAAGVMLGMAPLALALAAAVWALVLLFTGYVSLSSIAAAAVLPVAVYLLEPPRSPVLWWLVVLVAVGVIVLHRRNIERLLKGTENRFGRRAASSPRS